MCLNTPNEKEKKVIFVRRGGRATERGNSRNRAGNFSKKKGKREPEPAQKGRREKGGEYKNLRLSNGTQQKGGTAQMGGLARKSPASAERKKKSQTRVGTRG